MSSVTPPCKESPSPGINPKRLQQCPNRILGGRSGGRADDDLEHPVLVPHRHIAFHVRDDFRAPDTRLHMGLPPLPRPVDGPPAWNQQP
jgi:hypothetical protein